MQAHALIVGSWLDFVTALSGTKGLGLTVCPNGQQRSGPQVSRSKSADRMFGFTASFSILVFALCTYYHLLLVNCCMLLHDPLDKISADQLC